ncbi:condensation domain-containing protein [Micromonospora sp. M71_S20]|uniref:condensation domain-containing protein n=1 Tax=Micromonospora sp. M71_S20 TaxID=592872 RepID=UPI000F251DF7|nr:condensation domain-containing protein [Micromonospora sp. M71_S20]RLK09653.1 condensation domain-containing protein [Micromonospora sp. M71_S20]
MRTTDVEGMAAAADVAPLSLNQEFNSLFDGGGDDGPFGCRNHAVAAWRVTGGSVDPDVLRAALLDVVTRHEALRTRIAGPPDDRYQEILPPSPVRLDVRDFPVTAEASRAELAEALMHETETGTMSAHEAPFLRAVLARFDARDAVLVLMAHHLSVDGQSLAVIIRDLANRYAARTGHHAPDLPPAPQYREYGIWEREAATSPAAREYWRRQLDGARFTAIPTDIPRSAGVPETSARYRFLLPADVVSGIERVARANRSTRFMAIAAIYQLLVHRLTGVTDVVMAMFTPGRGGGRFDNTVGTLYNFVPLRTDLTGCTSYEEVLRRTRRTCLEAFSHDIPTIQIFAEAPQLMDSAMVDDAAAMVLESVPTNPIVDSPGDLNFVQVTRLLKSQELSSAVPDGALWDVNRDPSGDAIGAVTYKRNLFREETIASMAAEFREIARVFSSSPGASPGLV